MNVKLLLAEGIDVIKKGEEREVATDAALERMCRGGDARRDFATTKRQYTQAYDTLIRGCEILNFVRRSSMESAATDEDLIRFCAERITKALNRCETMRDKEANLLISVEQADSNGAIEREGYDLGQTLFFHPRSCAIKGGQPITWANTIQDGAYFFQVKYYDHFTVSPPVITATLVVTPRSGRTQRYQKVLPSRSAWGRYIGVVQSGTVEIKVESDAWMRQSHVEVVLKELISKEDRTAEIAVCGPRGAVPAPWIDELPELPPQSGTARNGAPPGGAPPRSESGDPVPRKEGSPVGGGKGGVAPRSPDTVAAPTERVPFIPEPLGGVPAVGPPIDPSGRGGPPFVAPVPEGIAVRPPQMQQRRTTPPPPPFSVPNPQDDPFANLPEIPRAPPCSRAHPQPEEPVSPGDEMDKLSRLKVPHVKGSPVFPNQPQPQSPPAPSSTSAAETAALTLADRLGRLRKVTSNWPAADGKPPNRTVELSNEEAVLVQRIASLPDPTALAGDDEIQISGDVDIDLGELEGEHQQ